jgi:hypothetical protein
MFKSMKIEYPAKVLLAWAEAVRGNKEIKDWLMANGYPELGLFVHALHNQTSARQWLMDNGFPHLMAVIRGSEGDENACLWLRKFELQAFEHLARAADNSDKSLLWLTENNWPELAVMAGRIRNVKNDIERSNNDVHRISAD